MAKKDANEKEVKEEVQVEEPKPEKTEEEIKAFREKVESIGMTKGKLSNTRKLASGTIIKRN